MSNTKSNFPNAAQPKATPAEIGGLVSITDELRRLPPIEKNNPEGVRERLDYYFRYCAENGVKCSVEGMVLATGRSRQTLWEWENDPKSKSGELVRRAKEAINTMLVQWAMDSKMPFPYAIWLQKNHYQYTENKVLEIKTAIEPQHLSIEEQIEQSGLVWDAKLEEFVPTDS